MPKTYEIELQYLVTNGFVYNTFKLSLSGKKISCMILKLQQEENRVSQKQNKTIDVASQQKMTNSKCFQM